MLASINPLGERARNRRWGTTVSAYLAGSLLGGGSLGALLGFIGARLGDLTAASPGTIAVLVAAACTMGLAFDLHLGGLRLPTVHRQVNKDWLDRYRGWVYGLGFGFQLGLGVVTVVNTAAIYLTFVLALLSGSAAAGLVIGATFGFVRGFVILGVRRAHRPEQLARTLRRLQSFAPASRGIGVGLQALAGVVVAGSVLGW